MIGNADDHLKNFSMLYGDGLKSMAIAPLYDVLSTAVYGKLFTEMGVSFGGSRRLSDVDRHAIESAVARCHLPVDACMSEFDELAETLPNALDAAAFNLSSQGFAGVDEVRAAIRDGIMHRRSFDHAEPKLLDA